MTAPPPTMSLPARGLGRNRNALIAKTKNPKEKKDEKPGDGSSKQSEGVVGKNPGREIAEKSGGRKVRTATSPSKKRSKKRTESSHEGDERFGQWNLGYERSVSTSHSASERLLRTFTENGGGFWDY